MISVGMKVFYEKATGIVLVITPSYQGDISPMTIDEYIQVYPVLRERDRDSFDVLALEYGQYEEDFMTARSWRVNLETKWLEFSYPDPNNPEAPSIFQPSLTEQVVSLKTENESLKNRVSDVEMTIAEILFS